MRNKRLALNVCLLTVILLTLPGIILAYDAGGADPKVLKSLYPGKAYSPYAKRSFPSHVYWGDTHLHTRLSLDAGLFGNTAIHWVLKRLTGLRAEKR